MERRYLNEFLRDITSTNTPGTNAVLRHHEALSRDFVPRSDLVLFVTSADRPFPESERDYPGIMHDWDKKIVLIVNKVDLLEAGERDETWDGDRGAPRSPYQASSLRRHLLALLASIPAGVDGLCVIRWQRPTIGSPPRTWCFHPGGGESHQGLPLQSVLLRGDCRTDLPGSVPHALWLRAMPEVHRWLRRGESSRSGGVWSVRSRGAAGRRWPAAP